MADWLLERVQQLLNAVSTWCDFASARVGDCRATLENRRAAQHVLQIVEERERRRIRQAERP